MPVLSSQLVCVCRVELQKFVEGLFGIGRTLWQKMAHLWFYTQENCSMIDKTQGRRGIQKCLCVPVEIKDMKYDVC